MEMIFLLLLSIVPGLFLMGIVIYMDRQEKEPMRMIMLAFILGVLSTIPAIIIELALSIIPIFSIPGIAGAFFSSFIQVAPVEELSKLGVILLFIYNNREFNEENDGIVYVAISALGFAVFENIFYVFQYGYEIGILRAVTAIPIHCFTGIIMGYFVGLSKFAENRDARKGKIIKGFMIAYIIHAFYNTCALSGTYIAILILPTVIATIITGVILLRKGRMLSIKRWHENPELIYTAEKKAGRWKIYISRTGFVLIALFWILLAAGYATLESSPGISLAGVLAGGVFLSIFPFMISLVLELSYRKGKKRALKADRSIDAVKNA